MSKTTKHIVFGAVFAAMATVLTLFVHFPIFPAAPFLEYDMGDVPLFFAAVLLGPWTGLAVTLVACVIQGLTVSAGSGVLGIVMHFIATGSFVLCAGLITRKKKMQRLVPALALGTLTQVLVMIPLNLIITPAFFVQDNVFRAVADNAAFALRCLFSFPSGALAAASGAIAALAFVVAFTLTIVYTDDEKREKQHNKKGSLHITFGGMLSGIASGLIYGILTLFAANLLIGSIHAPGAISSVYAMMYTVIVPFNAVKAGANAVIAGLLFFILGKRIVI